MSNQKILALQFTLFSPFHFFHAWFIVSQNFSGYWNSSSTQTGLHQSEDAYTAWVKKCLSVSLNLWQCLCGLEGLSVSLYLLWWFKTQVIYIESENSDPATSLVSHLISSMHNPFSCSFFIDLSETEVLLKLLHSGQRMHPHHAEWMFVSSIKSDATFSRSGDSSVPLHLLRWFLMHVKVTSLLPPAGKKKLCQQTARNVKQRTCC